MTLTNSSSSIGSTNKADTKNKMLFLLVVAIALSGLSTFLVFVNILYVRGIVNKQFPTLVQTSAGETIEIGFEDPNHRSPETIKKFTTDSLYYLMTMTAYGGDVGDTQKDSVLDPNKTNDVVPSMKIDDHGRITQNAWLTSYVLESGFAETFRAELAKMTPSTVFKGQEEVILKFSYVKEPEKVLNGNGEWTGEWTVDVIADLTVFKLTKDPGNIDTDSIPFNKRVTVRATDVPPITDVEKFGDLAVTIYTIQQQGLQITDIKDLSLTE